MNSPDHFSPADLKLDQALREALPPLTDDGFTGRVLMALPPPDQPALLTRRWVVCIGAAAGIAFAWQQQGFSSGTLASAAEALNRAFANTPDAPAGTGLTLGLMVTAVSLGFALKVHPRPPKSFL